ncbi:zinc metalloproteinase nas-4-like [Musca vetustissima]|uniref:zinc metalloproteinase nas-4-like n=1 Tax=Musca vetustissima TaxID=27455 RepID=UPI002AB6BD2A|nr:zinc metalloproteinase nas-4-like [Musca vetustissima]
MIRSIPLSEKNLHENIENGIVEINSEETVGFEINIEDFPEDPLPGNHLISQISEGFPSLEDSEVVEAATSVDSVPKDPNVLDLSVFGSSLYRIPDYNNTARLVDEYQPETAHVNPEELGSYLEGDILMPQSSVILKNGLVSTATRWPNGVVPYEIGAQFKRRELQMIHNAIQEYHQRTCIRFVPRTNEKDYISIVNGKSGCWSSIGRVGGKQEVNLQTPGCLTKPGTAIHELMHVLGFLHEQNRQERDGYVDIKYKNIKQAAYDNFKKVSPTIAFGVPYDYASVMHYSAKAFSQNGQPTIVAKHPKGNQMMGQRNGFSQLDIDKINRMYNCYDNEDYNDDVQSTEFPTSTTSERPIRKMGNVFSNLMSRLNP